MAKHVIVGTGAVGSTTARRLAEAGHEVRIVSRSGGGPQQPGVQRVAADATDSAMLTDLADGAAALYNCANPAYHRWETDWPPLASSLLTSAERTGAVLVTMANLYVYGPVDGPMTEQTPMAATDTKGRVRAAMWTEALAAHEAGRARVVEARASDFYGPGVTSNGHLGSQFVPRLLAGKPARLVHGDPDAVHSWTYIPDVADALIALGGDERAWGRVWHVPTAPPRSPRQAATELCEIAGVADRGVRVLPHWALRVASPVVPMLRELKDVRYQFTRPYVLDSSAYTTTFGVRPTAFHDGLRETVEWWRQRTSVAA
jgi:nucleoside-diphosphate-sugar epimerase